jgi:hypothetical protein
MGIFVTLWLALSSIAAEKKINLAPPRIKANAPSTIVVKETLVSFNGQQFRRVEYKSEFFYLRLQSIDGGLEKKSENRMNGAKECLKTNLPPEEQSARVLGEVKLTAFSSFYLEALHNKCETFDARTQSDAFLGVKIKTGENSDAKIGVGAGPGVISPQMQMNWKF